MSGPERVRKVVRKWSGTTGGLVFMTYCNPSPLPSLGCQWPLRCRFVSPGPLGFSRLPLVSGLAGRERSLWLANPRGPGERPRHPCGHPDCGPHSAPAEASCPLPFFWFGFSVGHSAAVCSSGEMDGRVHGASPDALYFVPPFVWMHMQRPLGARPKFPATGSMLWSLASASSVLWAISCHDKDVLGRRPDGASVSTRTREFLYTSGDFSRALVSDCFQAAMPACTCIRVFGRPVWVTHGIAVHFTPTLYGKS